MSENCVYICSKHSKEEQSSREDVNRVRLQSVSNSQEYHLWKAYTLRHWYRYHLLEIKVS